MPPRTAHNHALPVKLPLAALPVLLTLTLAGLAGAGDKVGPGPMVMSEEEKALQPDPAAGVEHAVILLEEIDRNDDLGKQSKTTFHRRVKILSGEGRALGDVEVPLVRGRMRLARWWGRTLLPDGTVRELKQSELQTQSIIRGEGEEVRAVKAALPGVVAGSVIDYGFVLSGKCCDDLVRVPLQRAWPVRDFRYHWWPSRYLSAASALSRAQGLEVNISREDKAVVITAVNLPPVPDEPMMPADYLVRAAVSLYYMYPGIHYETYWTQVAGTWREKLDGFNKDDAPLRRIAASLNLDPAASPDTKLRAAYDWLTAHVRNRSFTGVGEMRPGANKKEWEEDSAGSVLADGVATDLQLDMLFIGVARALGITTHLVLAADRTERVWEQALKAGGQFDASLVAVPVAGRPLAEALLIDPGSGLSYGEIPWWVTGANGYLIKADGWGSLSLRPSPAGSNATETDAKSGFSEDGDALEARWTRVFRGQEGLTRKLSYWRLQPEEEQGDLERRCGAEGGVDVASAESADAAQPAAVFTLSCEARKSIPAPGESVTTYHLDWTGPWITRLPDLPDGPRANGVVFSYPRSETLTLEVNAPRGFAPVEAPPPTRIRSPYGEYSLVVAASPTGYRVERKVALTTLAVPASEYGALRDFFSEVLEADHTPLVFGRIEARP